MARKCRAETKKMSEEVKALSCMPKGNKLYCTEKQEKGGRN